MTYTKCLWILGWPSLNYSCLRQNIKGYWLFSDGDHLKRPVPMSLSFFWLCWGLGNRWDTSIKGNFFVCVFWVEGFLGQVSLWSLKTLILALLLLCWRSFFSEMFKILVGACWCMLWSRTSWGINKEEDMRHEEVPWHEAGRRKALFQPGWNLLSCFMTTNKAGSLLHPGPGQSNRW